MSLWVSLNKKSSMHCGCPECKGHVNEEVFDANITHNLNKMAKKAGIYEAIWRPEDIGATTGKDITDILTEGLRKMKEHPQVFKRLDNPNGWGIYDDFLPWVESYLAACIEYPDAIIEVSR